ncbi:MAG TPA: hypothetical protein VKE25_07030, partial [Actinomycetes bacterium]|nr:hypothetical protein [Actinomycetes bacterium]
SAALDPAKQAPASGNGQSGGTGKAGDPSSSGSGSSDTGSGGGRDPSTATPGDAVSLSTVCRYS